MLSTPSCVPTGRAGEHSVSAGGVDLGSALPNQGCRRFHQRARGVDNVVDDQGAAAAHVADQVHDFANVDIDAALVHDGERGIEALGEEPRAFDAASIRRNDSQIWQIQMPEMLDEHRGTVKWSTGTSK